MSKKEEPAAADSTPESSEAPDWSAPAAGTIRVPRERLGPPGIQKALHYYRGPRGKPVADGAKASLADPEEREFHVVVHLDKEPGAFGAADLELAFGRLRGSSLVMFPQEIGLATPAGVVDVVTTSGGEAAALEFRCRVANWAGVVAKYSEHVAPLIDHLAYALDVPVFVRSIEWWDTKHDAGGMSFVAPFGPVDAPKELQFDLTFKPFYALYREALTSTSQYYQFLCYSKILEGIFSWAMPQLREAARKHNLPNPKIDARVENSEHILGVAKKWIGKSVGETFEKFIRPEFRNAIAHFAADDQSPVVVSHYMASESVALNLYLARHCARRALQAAEAIRSEMKTAVIGPETPTYSRSEVLGS